MIRPTVIFYLLFAVSNAFNTTHFLSHCIETNTGLYCFNFNWNAQELKEIQTQKFVISKALKVEFYSADIGVLNENLINKFPNAFEVTVHNCKVYLNSSRTSISQVSTRLETLRIQNSTILENKGTFAFNLLTSLKTFELSNPNFKNFSEIDNSLLAKNVNLNSVTISGLNVKNISDNAFGNLRKLLELTIRGTLLKSFPNTLLKNNQNLVSLILDSNQINSIQVNSFFPGNLQKLALNNNKIKFINDMRLNGLSKLKELNLNENGLLVLSPNAFKNLKSLEILRMEGSHLHNITRQHFEKNILLKEIYLSGYSLPNDLFDGLNFLELVKVNGF